MNDDVLARLLEKVEHRFYGKYRGSVVDNQDPDKRGRLRLKVPSVLGPDVVTGWALPCAPYGGAANQGFFFIPDNGASVWVEFEAGLLEFPVWVGTFWTKAGGNSEAPEPGNDQAPPTSKIIKTKNHTIELADADGTEAIKITDGKNQNKVTLDKKGILVQDQNGNQIKLESSGITIDSAAIKLGAGAKDKLILGDTLTQILTPWLTAVSTHVHPNGNMGSPTGPSPTLSPAPTLKSALSNKHSVE
jgi:uncharacterized protein involved in type VI secretion and phage assembly